MPRNVGRRPGDHVDVAARAKGKGHAPGVKGTSKADQARAAAMRKAEADAFAREAPAAADVESSTVSARPSSGTRAELTARKTVTLKTILEIAALPSSQRIAGWRTSHFDVVKAACTKAMETDPSTSLRSMLDAKADFGPSLDEIPALPAALERITARFVEGGMKADVKPVTVLPTGVQDYVIIGAGIAGAAAGAVFADANHAGAKLKGLVLEAGDTVGGRARDVDVNGKKAGLGPSWLHGKHNMLRRLADALGLKRERTFLDREVYIDGNKASDADTDALWAEEERAEDAMAKAVSDGRESARDPASKFFPAGRWKSVAEAEMGRGDQGMDIGKVDALDGSKFASDQDDFIQEGMQEFVMRLARAAELPVAFHAQVKSAKRDEHGIWNVELTDGRSVKTKQLIWSGSTAALGKIDVELPRAKTEILRDALPMGNFTKFLFTTKEPLTRPGMFRNSWVVDAVTNKETGKLHEDVQFVVKYGGDPCANIMFAAAGVARRLLALSDSEMKAAVEKQFEKVAGHPVHVEQLAHTPFAADPLFGGCYSNLLPGMEGAHTVYAAPVHGMHFVGEAAGTAQNNASLLAAFTSGIDSAYDAIAAVHLGHSKKPSPAVRAARRAQTGAP